MPGPKGQDADRLAMYREMQRAVPGLDGMYRLLHALIASRETEAPRVLIVGAGGGRELEELANGHVAGQITAIDPSSENLDLARVVVQKPGSSPEVRFLAGTVDAIPEGEIFDVVTSLLVMHHLKDDGAKLAYLKGLRERLAPGGKLMHADVCFDQPDDIDWLVPVYLAHAKIFGVTPEATRLERDAIPNLSVLSVARTEDLFAEAGLTEPCEVFRTLWYRCWISSGQS